jgi:hypothetical protein
LCSLVPAELLSWLELLACRRMNAIDLQRSPEAAGSAPVFSIGERTQKLFIMLQEQTFAGKQQLINPC